LQPCSVRGAERNGGVSGNGASTGERCPRPAKPFEEKLKKKKEKRGGGRLSCGLRAENESHRRLTEGWGIVGLRRNASTNIVEKTVKKGGVWGAGLC